MDRIAYYCEKCKRPIRADLLYKSTDTRSEVNAEGDLVEVEQTVRRCFFCHSPLKVEDDE